MSRARIIRNVVAGVVLVAFVATYLGMEWAGREPDSVLLLGAVAIALGAGYHLWDDAMGEGVDAAQDLQGNDSDEDEEEA